MKKLFRHLYLFSVALSLAMTTAHASDFPTRPVKIVVPYAPGGGGDVLARQFAEKLQPLLGQPVIVENRGP